MVHYYSSSFTFLEGFLFFLLILHVFSSFNQSINMNSVRSKTKQKKKTNKLIKTIMLSYKLQIENKKLATIITNYTKLSNSYLSNEI